MWRHILRRFLWMPFLLGIVSAITFLLGTYGPGDPVQVMLGSKYDEVTAERLRDSLGLNRPVIVQYADYISNAMRGDFGESLRFRGRSVSSLLVSKMWVSFQVNLAAMVVSLSLGLPLGFWIAHRQGSWVDPASIALSLMLMSIPIMVSIPLVLWALCLKLHWVPCAGWGGLFDLRIIVPAITMGIPGIAGLARLMRASTLDVMGQDFIRTAHSKGIHPITVDYRHILRNAIIPIITILSFSLAGMLTTGFITERLLGIPGVGDFAIQSIFNRDYPVIMAFTLILSAAFVIANLLADIAYTFVDPRIRYS
jgi:ABC-type dipeptide/oligopeptide/nickel transport system permease component